MSASWRIKSLGALADSYSAGSGSDFIRYLDQASPRQAQRGEVGYWRTHSFPEVLYSMSTLLMFSSTVYSSL